MKGLQKYKADEMHMMDSFKINALALLRLSNFILSLSQKL